MISGLGIDVVEVARIAKAMEHPRFLARILTPREREHCRSPQQVAGRWAAKEAVRKALGPVPMLEIEITNGPGGEPVLGLPGSAAMGRRCLVSIAHERSVAVAVVTVETVAP